MVARSRRAPQNRRAGALRVLRLAGLAWLLSSCSSLLPAPEGAHASLPHPPLPPREALSPDAPSPQPPVLSRATPLAEIAFGQGSATLDAASSSSLAALAPSLPATPILVVGRSSAWGGPEFARLLSTSRANAVRVALIEAGADPAQLHIAGLGTESPPEVPAALLASPPDMATILLLGSP